MRRRIIKEGSDMDAITELLINTQSLKTTHIQNYLEKFRDKLQAEHIARMLQGVSLRRSFSLPKPMMIFIMKMIKENTMDRTLDNEAISKLFYGLRLIHTEEELDLYVVYSNILVHFMDQNPGPIEAKYVAERYLALKEIPGHQDSLDSLTKPLLKQLKDCIGSFDAEAISNVAQGLTDFKCTSKDPVLLETLKVLTQKMNECTDLFGGYHIKSIMQGIESNDSDEEVVRQFLVAITKKVDDSVTYLTGEELGYAMRGLKNMSSEHSEVREMVVAMTRKIKETDKLLPNAFTGYAMLGLQNMTSEHAEVRGAIAAIAAKLKFTFSKLSNPTALGHCLYGLRGMDMEHEEVYDLVQVLVRKIKESKHAMQASDLANCFHGMQKMRSEEPIVKELLKLMMPRIKAILKKTHGSHVADICYGLQRMNVEQKEVQDLLLGIERIAREATGKKRLFTGEDIGKSLLGMKSMSSVYPAAHAVFTALRRRSVESTAPMTGHQVCQAMHGLQSSPSETVMIRNIVGILADKLAHTREPPSSTDIGLAMYGMHCMESQYEPVVKMVSELKVWLRKTLKPIDGRTVGNILYGMQCMNRNDTEVRDMLKVLAQKMEASMQPFQGSDIALAATGLRCASSENEEGAALWDALIQKVKDSPALEMSGPDLTIAMTGLALTKDPRRTELVSLLVPSLVQGVRSIAAAPLDKKWTGTERRSLMQSMSLFEHTMDMEKGRPETWQVDEQRNHLTALLQAGNDAIITMNNSKPTPMYEDKHPHARFQKAIMTLLADKPQYSVERDGFLGDSFPADIIIIENSSGKVYNLEIDGPNIFNFVARKKFNAARDAYLTSKCNVKVVVRMEVDGVSEKEELFYASVKYKAEEALHAIGLIKLKTLRAVTTIS